MNAKHYLAGALLAMAALFLLWFAGDPHWLAGLVAFMLPPLLLAAVALRGWHRSGFMASLFALLWFCHGIMTAWSEPDARWLALAETALALVVIHAACLPGIRARRAARAQQ